MNKLQYATSPRGKNNISRYANMSASYSKFLTRCFADGFIGSIGIMESVAKTSAMICSSLSDHALLRDVEMVGHDLKKVMDVYAEKLEQPSSGQGGSEE